MSVDINQPIRSIIQLRSQVIKTKLSFLYIPLHPLLYTSWTFVVPSTNIGWFLLLPWNEQNQVGRQVPPKNCYKIQYDYTQKYFFGKLLVVLNHFVQIKLLLYQHQILNDFYFKKLTAWKDTEKLWMIFLSQLPYMVWRISPGTGASQKSSGIFVMT